MTGQFNAITVRPNNFDLIRLAAALQVVVVHANEHLHLSEEMSDGMIQLLSVIGLFPGVPIFFVISGFLISRSFESSQTIMGFAWKRILRIYPGLWCAFLVSLILVLGSRPQLLLNAEIKQFLLWTVAQVSIIQFYNPQFLRAYGVGVLNGSLWTIPVEMQFYMATPLIYYLCCSSRDRAKWRLPLVIFVFIVVNRIWSSVPLDSQNHISFKLLSVSMVPYFWVFLIGVWLQQNWLSVRRYFESKFVFWITAYVVFCLAIAPLTGMSIGSNNSSILATILLAGVTMSAAFSTKRLAGYLLRGTDLSYGVYIYHMLVVNFLLEIGLSRSFYLLPVVLVISLFAASLSWFFIESPLLRQKVDARGLEKPFSHSEICLNESK